MAGNLYSVALSIGNVKDITPNARDKLQQTDFIACEDTRKLKACLQRLDIKSRAKFISYHSYNEENSANGIVELLKKNKDVSLTTDAGTPRVSDPGYHLIKKCWENNIRVIPIPGVSAMACIISIAPFPVEPLLFLGFLSSKSSRRENTFKKYIDFKGSVCIYESVHRLKKNLENILSVWGRLADIDRKRVD